MTANIPTRRQVDAAEPLEFAAPPRQERNDISIQIEAGPDGLRVRCDYIGSLASIPQAIERLRAAGVLELATPSKPSAAAQPAPTAAQVAPSRAERVAPTYKPDGTPCCPVHHKPLVEGRYGLYCPSKAKEGEQANDKGYCSLKFID